MTRHRTGLDVNAQGCRPGPACSHWLAVEELALFPFGGEVAGGWFREH